MQRLALVIGAALLSLASARIPGFRSNRLELSEAALGPFLLQWDHAQPFLQVSSRASGRVLWKTIRHWPFVSVGYASENSEPIIDGNYNVQEYTWYETPQQTINSVKVSDMAITFSGEVYGLITQAKYELVFRVLSDQQLGFSLNATAVRGAFNRLFLNYWCDAAETFHGFGTQFSYVNFKGLRVPVVVSEQGVGRGLQPVTAILNWGGNGAGGYWYTSYAPKPGYVTNQNRSVLFENSEVMYFDLRNSEAVIVEAWATEVHGRIFAGDSMLDLVEQITEVTGRMRPLPRWSQEGAVIGLEGGTKMVAEIVEKMWKLGTPIKGVWLQDWVGMRHSYDGDRLVWNWELNTDYYTGWHGMVESWKDRDIRVMTYVNPFFSDPTNFTTPRHNYFQEGVDRGFFVRTASGEPYLMNSGSITFCMLDPTNPDAVTWMKSILRENLMGEARASGWMADFGEYLPFDGHLYSGEDCASYHNKFPEAWAKINQEAVAEAGKSDEVVYFMRSAWLRSPEYTSLFWLGDQLVTWDGYDGIRTVITGALTGGLFGHTLTHSDIGGYTMEELGTIMNYTRTPELLMRWSELAAFGSALYRTHVGSSLSPSNAQVWDNAANIKHFGRFGVIFAELADYRMELMEIAHTKGYPLMRPLSMHFGYDAHTWDMMDTYLFGEDILVAPVLDHGVEHVDAYIPAHTDWVHIWSEHRVSGGEEGRRVRTFAPIGFPPVFAREGSEAAVLLRNIVEKHGFGEGYEWRSV